MQTLEELKAENAAAEQEPIEESASDIEESDVEAVEESEEEGVELAEVDAEESDEDAIDDWMKEGEELSNNDDQFTGSDIAAAKRKLRAKLEKKHNSELEELKAELEALKAGNVQQVFKPEPTVKAKPKLEDFDYDEAQYESALSEWIENKVNSQISAVSKSANLKTQQEAAQRKFTESIDNHYERAAVLVKDAGIDPEVYQQADAAVRTAVSEVRPQDSEIVVDQLIDKLGEGSEKVMYYLGRNRQAQELFKAKLLSDPSGFSAFGYLVELKATKTQKPVIKSKAKKPSVRIQGDAKGDTVDAFYKQYKKAKGVQDRLNIKFDAKKAGIDTRNW